jgi:hypothetical protein
MTHTSKILSLVATICALPAGLLHAQSSFGAVQAVQFTTTFPFYVSNQMMPAGSYTVSQLSINGDELLIRDTDFRHSASVLYNPTTSTEAVAHGEVTFHQYGNVDFLGGLTLTGEATGAELPESRTEKRAAVTNRGVASTKSVALQAAAPGY